MASSDRRLRSRVSDFELLIAGVPAVLESLPAESQRAVAATSWASLLAVLDTTPFELNFDVARAWRRGGLLRGLAQRLERRSVPMAGSLHIDCAHDGGTVCSKFAADDARAIVAGGRLELAELHGLDELVRRSEEAGAPVRVRGLRDMAGDGEGQALVAFLGRYPSIREHLREIHDMPDLHGSSADLMRALAPASSLRKLWVFDSGLTPEGLVAFAEAARSVPDLRYLRLDLHLGPGAGDRMFRDVDDTAGLVALMGMLRDNTTIEKFEFGNHGRIGPEGYDAVGSMLRGNATLRKLDLDAWHSGLENDDGERCEGLAAALGAGLAANETLEDLWLSDNEVRGEQLGRGLAKNRTLKTLLIDGGLDGAGLAALGAAIGDGSVLERLRVSDCSFGSVPAGGHDSMALFAGAVMRQSCLVELDLSHTSGITTDAITALGKALAEGALGRTLKVLALGQSGIDPEDVGILAEALHGNDTLQELELPGVLVEDAGTTEVASMLEVNSTLLKLDLSGTAIDCLGARSLAEALSCNKTLRVMSLRANYISHSGGAALAAALSKAGADSALETLLLDNPVGLYDKPMGDDTLKAFVSAKRAGAPLRVLGIEGWEGVKKATVRSLEALGCRRGKPHLNEG
ncbi:unnamed protein product [Pedinophyceae sp. YPF-701]|nr:unnamed protein product [Pedinophyceae sp. YPF-701]